MEFDLAYIATLGGETDETLRGLEQALIHHRPTSVEAARLDLRCIVLVNTELKNRGLKPRSI